MNNRALCKTVRIICAKHKYPIAATFSDKRTYGRRLKFTSWGIPTKRQRDKIEAEILFIFNRRVDWKLYPYRDTHYLVDFANLIIQLYES